MTQLIRNVFDLVGTENRKYRIEMWRRPFIWIIPKKETEDTRNNIDVYHIPVPVDDTEKAKILLKEYGFNVEFVR